MKAAIIGDSYSTCYGWNPDDYASYYTQFGNHQHQNDMPDSDHTWWALVMKRLHLDLDVNCSYSGSTVCNTGYEGNDFSAISFVTHIKRDLGEGRKGPAPDLIFIFGGTNDFWAGSPIGEIKYEGWTEKDLYSFAPAYCYMVRYLKKWNPNARVIHLVNDAISGPVSDTISEICEHEGQECLYLENITKEEGHPNREGMEQIASQVISWLLYHSAPGTFPQAPDPFWNTRRKLAIDHYSAQMEEGPVNIVAFGDSVTHGCFDWDEYDYHAVWHARLAEMLREKYAYNPINMINEGIGGVTGIDSVKRLNRDVLSFHPDLVIICFGLNDVSKEADAYEKALADIFAAVKKAGSEIIFLTPNMMNTRVRPEVLPKEFEPLAERTASCQTNGRMDHYMDLARKTAEKYQVPVCDVYAEWKKMADSGVDTDLLLANGINHPNREMHELAAKMLYQMIVK